MDLLSLAIGLLANIPTFLVTRYVTRRDARCESLREMVESVCQGLQADARGLCANALKYLMAGKPEELTRDQTVLFAKQEAEILIGADALERDAVDLKRRCGRAGLRDLTKGEDPKQLAIDLKRAVTGVPYGEPFPSLPHSSDIVQHVSETTTSFCESIQRIQRRASA